MTLQVGLDCTPSLTPVLFSRRGMQGGSPLSKVMGMAEDGESKQYPDTVKRNDGFGIIVS